MSNMLWFFLLIPLLVQSGKVNMMSVEPPDKGISIGKFIKEDQRIIDQFKSSDLRSIVTNPDALPLLKKGQLESLLEDPIFSVSLPPDQMKGVNSLVETLLSQTEGEDDNEEETQYENEDDYEEYDYLDYYDDQEIAVNDFISDLDPEFLKSLSSDLIIAYFESLSPDDLKTILNSSSIILNLPTDTTIDLLHKVPKEKFDSVVNSEGVKRLFNSSSMNLSTDEIEFMDKFTVELITKLDLNLLLSLPEFLIRSQLNNRQAVQSLLEQPDKLKSLLGKNPDLVEQVPVDVLIQVFDTNSEVLNNIFSSDIISILPDSVIIKLASEPKIIEKIPDLVNQVPVDVVINVFDQRSQLLGNILQHLPKSIILNLASDPKIIKIIPDFVDQVRVDLVIQLLDQQQELLSYIIQNLPKSVIRNLASDPKITDKIPDFVDQIPVDLVIQILYQQQELLNTILQNVPISVILALARNPKIIERIPELADQVPVDLVIQMLDQQQELLSDIIPNLPTSVILYLASDPRIIEKIPDLVDHVPVEAVLQFLDQHPELPSEPRFVSVYPELLAQLPTRNVVILVKRRPQLVIQLSSSMISLASQRIDVLESLSDQDLRNLISLRPSLLLLLQNFPRALSIQFLQQRIHLLDILPPSSEPTLAKLLGLDYTVSLVGKMPIQLLISLIRKPVVRRNVDKFIIIKLLQAQPNVGLNFPLPDLIYYLHFLHDPWFRLQIPCETIAGFSGRRDLDFNLVPITIFKIIMTSRRILSCIPAQNLEQLMEQGDMLGLGRLPVDTLIKSARRLPPNKYSINLVMTFLSRQAPDIVSKMFHSNIN